LLRLRKQPILIRVVGDLREAQTTRILNAGFKEDPPAEKKQ
jgi:hypothetical protein